MNADENEYQQALNNLSDAALESLNEEGKDDLEGFENYTQALRCHIKTDETDFRVRFLQGYDILLKEIDNSIEK